MLRATLTVLTPIVLHFSGIKKSAGFSFTQAWRLTFPTLLPLEFQLICL